MKVIKKEKKILAIDDIRADVAMFLPGGTTLDDDMDLISAGLDSLKIMKLVNRWRKSGAKISFAQCISSPCVRAWSTLMAERNGNAPESAPMGDSASAEACDVFPLSDIQKAYLAGRQDGQTLGGVGCHAYLEIRSEAALEPSRLQKAWDDVLHAHGMLRAAFSESGEQHILPVSPNSNVELINLEDLSSDSASMAMESLRRDRSHRRLDVASGEVTALAQCLLPDGSSVLLLDMDMLAVDVMSLCQVIHDLARAYDGGTVTGGNFGRWLAKEGGYSDLETDEARQYWEARVDGLPGGPDLPLARRPEEIRRTETVRHRRFLGKKTWEALKKGAASSGATMVALLLAAYAEVLSRWSGSSNFLINIPMSDRRGASGIVGEFTRVELLEVNLSPEEGFLGHLQGIGKRLYADMDRLAWSGVRVLRDLARRGAAAPVVFAGNIDTVLISEADSQVLGKVTYMLSQTPQVWLDFQLYADGDGGQILVWDAVEELFPEGMLDAMFDALADLLVKLAERVDGNGNAAWKDSVEVIQHLEFRDSTPVPSVISDDERASSLHANFFALAAGNPNATALVDLGSGDKLSYGGLAERALRIAGALRACGVGKGDLVAMTLPRGHGQIEAVLGILAAGAAYAPVSIDQPFIRRERIHAGAGIRFVVTDAEHKSSLEWPGNCTVLDIAECLAHMPLPAPFEPSSGNQLAYVIFTSGSTGEPKGVEIPHAGALNTIQSVNRICEIGKDDRALAVSSMDFDLSVYDVFGLLSAGGSLVLLSEESRRNASVWADAVERFHVTVWNSVPMLADMLLTAAESEGRQLSSIRTFMLSGDWIMLSLPERLRARAPHCRIAAMGGATEASIWSNIFMVEPPVPQLWTSIPYGRGLPGQCWRIVDDMGRDCPDWTPGELWIGGCGLAIGYRNDFKKTNAAFVERDGRRWYRTGDLGRFWPDGTMEFLGRRDFQVKFHGHRVELGEIAAALRQQPSVRDAAASIVTVGGLQRLVGYIVPKEGMEVPPVAALADFLRERVPAYMVVTHYVILEKLPLTGNGKIDRKRLPVPDFKEERTSEVKAGMTPLQNRIAEAWAGLLGGHKPSLSENFFEAGGDSLQAIRLSTELRSMLGISFGVDSVLQNPTVEGMAAIATERLLRDDHEVLEQQNNLPCVVADTKHLHEAFPLTDVQQAYLIGRSGAYELGDVPSRYYCEFDGKNIDTDKLQDCWNMLVERHPMMRAIITADGRQRILKSVPEIKIKLRDLRNISNQNIELDKLRRELPSIEMSLYEWPLFNISCTKIDDITTRIHLVFDNIMFDGRSVFILLDELSKIYQDKKEIKVNYELSFRDYVIAISNMKESDIVKCDVEYWKERIKNMPQAPVLALGCDPSQVKNNSFVRRSMELSSEESKKLAVQAASHGMTLSGVLLSAYSEILARWSTSPKFTINLTMFNRVPFSKDVDHLIGDFTALTLLAVDMGAGCTFEERAHMVQAQLWKDLAHSHVGGMQVMRELRGQGKDSRMPVVFTSGLGLEESSSVGTIGELEYSITQTPQVWLDHQVSRRNGNLVLAWDAVEALFSKGVLDAMFASYCRLVHRLANGDGWEEPRPETTGAEQISDSANATESKLPEGTLLDALRRTLRGTPDAPAVIAKDMSLTYSELYECGKRTADKLLEMELPPLTAIVMEKGWEQAVATVACLLAGTAWLPMEADVPGARMETVFAEAGVKVVLTQRHLVDKLPWPAGVRIVTVDGISGGPGECGRCDSDFPGNSLSPDAAAYVIYTSGSTGKPKGVVISHAAVLNTLVDVNRRFNITASDRAFALSHLSFDLSVYDLWGMFLCGGAVVMPEPGSDRDPSRWLPLLMKHHVTVWNSVPALMQMLSGFIHATKNEFPKDLRVIMMSGDWIPTTLPDELRDMGSKAAIYSLGGATEASIWSNFYPIGAIDPAWKSIPYGRPLANQRFRILDEMGEERPIGVPGELCIAGAGLANGYWNDPERTEKAFFSHPVTGERLYRTGDLGLRKEDGDMVFLGRNDFQIKLRGFRIELGEVEHAARRLPEIHEAVAVVTGTDAADRRLALIVSAPAWQRSGSDLEEAVLAVCRHTLPDYMVPSTIRRCDVLPLSGNGKIDRKALVHLAELAQDEKKVERETKASTATEEALSSIWKELLGRDDIGIAENFFEAGGTSVLAVSLYQRVLAFAGREVPMVWVFEYPTVRSFARALDGMASDGKLPPSAEAKGESIAAKRGRMRREGRMRR